MKNAFDAAVDITIAWVSNEKTIMSDADTSQFLETVYTKAKELYKKELGHK